MKGFLAILVLVLVLVAILWTVKSGQKGGEAIKQEVDAFRRVQEKVTRSNLESLERAISVFLAQTGRTPRDLKEIHIFRPAAYAAEDAWGTPLKYERISDSRYRLRSAGEDRVFGTQDDITLEN